MTRAARRHFREQVLFHASLVFAVFFAATFFTWRGGKSKPILPSLASNLR
jgi:hypothetical protein